MPRTRRLPPVTLSAPPPSLKREAGRGALAGLLVGVCVLCGVVMLRLSDGSALPAFGWGLSARVMTGLLSVSLGTAIARAGWTRVRSVFGAMCVGILAVTVGWLGLLASVPGGVPFLMLRFIWLAFPVGAFLGFVDWNNLYRNVRPRPIPPSA